MRRHARIILFSVTAFLFAAQAVAQVVTGTPPFGSFSGGPDIVNNANLNVHWNFPVLVKPGRGLPFSYVLTYDSSVWYPVGSSGSQVWTPVANWGWQGVTQVLTGYVTFKITGRAGTCPPLSELKYYSLWSNFVYHDTFGALHSFPGLEVQTNCNPGDAPNEGEATTVDGSGYTLDVWSDFTTNLIAPSGNLSTPP
jgi:hypothetical protein